MIVEGCKKYIRRDLPQLCEMIRPLMHDPVTIVNRKASFFFTEVAEYMDSALIEVAPWLMQDISKMITSNDAASIENGLVLIEVIGIKYGRTHQQDMLSILVQFRMIHDE